jgi:ribosomal protein S18 acetylase RimI-like enzyme
MTATATRQALLRPLTPADRGAIEAFSRAIPLFRPDEIEIALEVLDTSFKPEQRDYTTLGAELDGRLVGWICWGPTPCTLGTYDMYWVAVDPSVQGAGVGSLLVAEMERRLVDQARLIVVETSGRREYGPTRAFYMGRGYRIAAKVPDFYAAGDDQVIFVKTPASPRAETSAKRR